MDVALSCDHRVVYGAEAARFLQHVRHLLEHPSLLLLEGGSAVSEVEFREAIRAGARRGAGARRARLPDGRGRGRRGRRLRGHARPARAARPRARLRHADLRARDDRGRVRRRASPASGPVLEIMFGDFLALSMDSLINQATKYWFLTGGKQSVAARDPLGRRRRRPLRRDPLADAGLVADGHPGPEDRRALDARRREGAAEGGDPRREPGDLLRAQAALLDQGRGQRRRARPARACAGRARGRRRHARQRDEGRPRLPGRRRAAGASRASRRR